MLQASFITYNVYTLFYEYKNGFPVRVEVLVCVPGQLWNSPMFRTLALRPLPDDIMRTRHQLMT